MRPVTRRTAVVALCALMVALVPLAIADGRRAGAQQPPDSAQPMPRPVDGPDVPPAADGRRGGMRRELTDKDVDRIIATARDVEPAWADALESLRKEDPARLRQRLGAQARMLMGLSMLRERQPELYQARVDDLRVQRQLRAAVDRLKQARESGDADAEQATRSQIREFVDRQFELEVKARAHELVAMERALKEARKRLQTDIQDRAARTAEALEAAERGEMPRFGRASEGEGGPWPWREGGRGPGDRPPGDRPAAPPPAP